MLKDFSGNKGEWSEPYVVFRLLSDGKLCQADRNLLPSSDEYAHILEIVRGDTTASVLNSDMVNFSYVDTNGQMHTVQTHKTALDKQARRLFKSICAMQDAKGAFELPTEVDDLRFYGFRRLTNPAPKKLKSTKRDLRLKLDGTKTGIATLGFSVKSELGAPPTLLNASEPTNIVYRVKGLTREQAANINGITGSRKIMERCRAIKQFAAAIEYDSYYSETFKDNLEIVDSSLPEMLANLVKVHYFRQILLPRETKRNGAFREADKLSSAVEILSKTEPYALKRKGFCEIKIKRFLRACALGLMPSAVWDGRDDASGGYIIVLPDGRLVALYMYNTNLFEQYLYDSTIFERASTSRHHYMSLVPDGETGDYLLKLNLQIRFNR